MLLLRSRPTPSSSSSSSSTRALANRPIATPNQPSPSPPSNHPNEPPTSRAAAALAAAALAATALLSAAPLAALAAPTPANSPLLEAKTQLVFGPTADGSIRPCQGNIQPNCVSTASTNDLYSPPWRAPLTVAEAARALDRAVAAVEPTARLVQSADNVAGTGAAYRAWQSDGVFGPDIFEVVVKPESSGGVVERGGSAVAGGQGGGETSQPAPPSSSSALVTYRSSATQVKYVYPFQIALTDGDKQRKRATAVRAASNFALVGCSDLECYIE